MIVQINIHSAPVSLSTIQYFRSGVNYWLSSQNQMRQGQPYIWRIKCHKDELWQHTEIYTQIFFFFFGRGGGYSFELLAGDKWPKLLKSPPYLRTKSVIGHYLEQSTKTKQYATFDVKKSNLASMLTGLKQIKEIYQYASLHVVSFVLFPKPWSQVIINIIIILKLTYWYHISGH